MLGAKKEFACRSGAYSFGFVKRINTGAKNLPLLNVRLLRAPHKPEFTHGLGVIGFRI